MKTLLLIISLIVSTTVHADPLKAGNMSFGVQLGGASVGNENYNIAGISIHYFALDNLSIGGDYEYWFSGQPRISKASLDSTYYIPATEELKPYLGLLYSHYFIEKISDIDAYGYRVGLAYISSPMIFSAGLRQEKYQGNRSFFSNEDATGEFMIGFTF